VNLFRQELHFHAVRAVRVLRNPQHYRAAAAVALISLSTSPSYALSTSLAPGQNFDLSNFTLQLPTGSPGNPDTVSQPALTTYQDSGHQYFFTSATDGSMIMKVYGDPSTSGCVTTPNSTHCRTELRENGSWSPTAATNRMKATVVVTAIANASVVIGQIHINDSISTKPVMELYYESNGDLVAGVEINRDGSGGQTHTTVGHVPIGTKFAYEIEYYSGGLKVAIAPDLNSFSGHFTTLSQNNLNNPSSYFKAGCYDQGTGLADVHFWTLTIEH